MPLISTEIETISETPVDDESTAEKCEKLRTLFLEDWKLNNDAYDVKDVDKIKHCNWTLERFLLHCKGDIVNALDMIKEAMKWRKSIDLNNLKESDFPREFYEAGSFFRYAKDKHGNVMLYIRGKLHRKVPEWTECFKKFFVFVVNQVEQEAGGKNYAVLWDCEGAGLQNVDMDIMGFMTKTITSYFPYGVEYILLYELPWVLYAIYTLAKSWVPESYQRIVQFGSKEQVLELISIENLPDYMGGTCDQCYKKAPDNCITAEEYEHKHQLPEHSATKLKEVLALNYV